MDGILLINKNIGISSFGICSKVKKKLGIKKVGHSGTLDPNASGVMTILVGEGTKLSKVLVEHNKEYKACLKLGIKTQTADSEGKMIEEQPYSLSDKKDEIESCFRSFVGKLKQIPPMYSAIKVDGKKLYEYARSGKEVERKEREVEIFSICIDEIRKEDNEIDFTVSCSKGTYIRTLCEQIAEKLGTVGYMKSLIRTKVNDYTIEDSMTVEEMDSLTIEEIEKKIISIEEVFKDKEKIDMTEKGIELLKNGVMLTYKLKDDYYRIYNKNKFIGIGIVKNNLLKRDIIL
jgi:tRNA pseudouridine55 synthase